MEHAIYLDLVYVQGHENFYKRLQKYCAILQTTLNLNKLLVGSLSVKLNRNASQVSLNTFKGLVTFTTDLTFWQMTLIFIFINSKELGKCLALFYTFKHFCYYTLFHLNTFIDIVSNKKDGLHILIKSDFPDNIKGLFVELNIRKSKWLLGEMYHQAPLAWSIFFNTLRKFCMDW